MRNLLQFLVKNSFLFVFILLELICFYFIFSKNSYQNSIFLNSSNAVSGRIYSVSGGVSSYFGLKKTNEELLAENATLTKELIVVKNYLSSLKTDENSPTFFSDIEEGKQEYNFMLANVVNNAFSQNQNYLTINKGSIDGIKKDMGVISHQGIVGVVRETSKNYAVVQSMLHPRSTFICKVRQSNAHAPLVWNGKDIRYAILSNYPKFETINKGDTVITTGFSSFFPEGIPVGIIDDYKEQSNGNFLNIKVELFTDFSAIKNVIVIEDKDKQEKKELEELIYNAEKQ